MAKISARGCTAIAKVKAKSKASGNTQLFVMRSDGMILNRFTGDLGDGYTAVYKVKCVDNINKAFLERYVALRGLTII
jgi:hypothetical protein